jgi:hypothetical protein
MLLFVAQSLIETVFKLIESKSLQMRTWRQSINQQGSEVPAHCRIPTTNYVALKNVQTIRIILKRFNPNNI